MHQPSTPAAWADPLVIPAKGTSRPQCLLLTPHGDPGLIHALLQVISVELDAIEFTLRDDPALDSIWLCGYETGTTSLIRGLRSRHPQCRILVTRCGGPSSWRDEVLEAGADEALFWPVALSELLDVLASPRQARSAALRPGASLRGLGLETRAPIAVT